MKKRKILSLFLSLCLLIGLLPTAALAADQVADESGVRITEAAYDSTNNILTINVDIKMPNSTGINTVGSLISYDSSKLTLMDASRNTLYTATSSQTKATSAVTGLLACEETTTIPGIGTFNTPYNVVNADLYGVGSRAGLFVGMSVYPGNTPKTSQKTTDWLTIYQLRFKVSGNAADVLNSDSLRIADPAKDNDVIKGAYPANNKFVISVDSGDSIGYKYGKMKGYTGGDVSGNNYVMNSANVTATYPGSTNSPSATTYTVTVQNDGNGTASASPATAAAGTEITLTATPNSGYVFNEWVEKNPTSLTIGADGKFTMPSENVSVKATFKPAALTGTASITGTLKYGQELTATLTGSNNTGNLDYKWYQNGTTQVAANNTGKYTLRADDIGKTITVKITSSVQTGVITSAATAAVEKADGPAAPTSVTPVACTNSSNNDGKLQNVTNAMEYQKSGAGTWTACSGTEVTGLTNGTYYVRVAETPTHKAGTAATVIVSTYTPGALGGSASISGTAKYGEVLTAVTSSITGNTGTLTYKWYRSGETTEIATNNTGKYTLRAEDIGKTITVKVSSSIQTGVITSAATAAVEKADGPAAPTSVTPVACTNSSNNDGKLQNVTNAMEYQKSGAGTWTACSGTEVTGLTNGTYYVRVAETTTHKAGTAATVNVPAYTPGVLGGSASISGTAKYDEVLTAVTSSITGNTGTFSYQWKRSGTDITSATNSTYKLVEDDIGKTITVAITSSVESGTIVSSPTAAVEKADGPAAPSVTPVACTNSSNNDGKITGVNTTMEYQKSGAATWTACSGTEVTGLTNGTYYVRVAETTTHKAGTAATVIVSAYTPGVPTEYTITFDGNGGTPSTSSMTTTGQKLTSLPTATRSGSYTFAGWYTAASGGTKVTTSTIFNANTTIYAQWTYTGGSVVIIPDTDETDKSEPENPGTGAAVNPGTGAAAAGSSFGYPFVALAAVHAIYAGTKKLAKKDED